MKIMSLPWFHHPDLTVAGTVVQMSHDEARHARGARRLNEGDEVRLFDGVGAVARARITSNGAKGRDVVAEVLSVKHIPQIEPVLTVASAVPKGDRLSTLLGMTAQLGVRSFVPLQCARSIAEGGQRLGPRGVRIILEACKQARCAHAMTIAAPRTVAGALEDAERRGDQVLLADPTGGSLPDVLAPIGRTDITLLIGPEGGFTDDECNACQTAGTEFVSLGTTTLRIETACVALASAIRLWTSGA